MDTQEELEEAVADVEEAMARVEGIKDQLRQAEGELALAITRENEARFRHRANIIAQEEAKWLRQ
jgi:division protein CdvB (Snf7/Vps24/ESCRT-III family)